MDDDQGVIWGGVALGPSSRGTRPECVGLEDARIGGSGVRLCGILLDMAQGQGLEVVDEFAKASGVVQQRA